MQWTWRNSKMGSFNQDDLLAEWGLWFRDHGFGTHSLAMADQVADLVLRNEPLSVIRDLTPEQKADAREIFEGKNPDRRACRHCAGLHHAVAGLPDSRQPCHRVKSIKWNVDGEVSEVEYWP